jgi:hypothetical protein
MHFKGFKPIKLTGEPGPTVGDGHQDRCASDRKAALKQHSRKRTSDGGSRERAKCRSVFLL